MGIEKMGAEGMTVLDFVCVTCGGTHGEQMGDYIKCKFCGNKHKRRLSSDTVFVNLQMALDYRQSAKFDDAREKYDKIIKEHKDDPALEDAYWGKFLCEQRVIFYQNDQNVSIPSFWEVSQEACTASKSYQTAIKYGEKSGNKDNYKALAEKIEEYKEKYKKIEKEQYQVFICFKNSGTNDINLGYEIYRKLCVKYNVFFSPESLKGKSGLDYEPYIYNALKTAKVMILICSSRENIESKWVRNEWWRFYHFARGTDRTITPVFRTGFQTYELPDVIRNCNGYPEGVSLISNLEEHIAPILRAGNNRIVMNSFEQQLSEAAALWEAKDIAQAKSMVSALIKDSATRPYDHVEALLLMAKICSSRFKYLKNAEAKKAIENAISTAKSYSVEIDDMADYKLYRAAVGKSRFKIVLIALLAAAAIAGGTLGIIQAVQDPMVDIYVTGNPTSVEVAYGESLLSEVTSITTVSKKGNEEQIELTASMISGFDPSVIGVQNVTISYEGMDITLSVNVVKYTLPAPTDLTYDSGRITWTGVPKAQKYTLKINDDVIEGITAESYEDYTFTSTGLFSIQVKAIADGSVGMDSAYTDTVTVIKLAEASNLKFDGTTLTWDEVPNCNQYDVYINGTKMSTALTNSYTVIADALVSGANDLYVMPIGASNIKLREGISDSELTDYDHNSEIRLYKYRQASGLAWNEGNLIWNSVAGATYAVYINDELVGRTEETSFTPDVSQMAAGDNKVYVIPENAINITTDVGTGTDYENNGVITVKKLDKVTGLAIGNRELSWTAVDGATEYEIYINGKAVSKTTGTTYSVVVNNSNPRTEVYTIKAYGGYNVIDSEISDESVTVGILPAPTGLRLEGAILSWYEVSQASGYEIYADNNLIATVDADARSLNMLGKLEKGKYELTVVAIASGETLFPSVHSQPISYDVSETIIYVTNEEELRNVSLALDALYVLGNDITLSGSWTPIGETAHPFVGRFNGNGHSITNLNVTAESGLGTGLFGVVGEAGIVANLVVKNAVVDGAASYGCVGTVVGINRGTVREVTAYGTVTARGGDNVGGIVGRNYGSIYDCDNHTTVVGKKYVGGISGNCEISNFDVSIYGCNNYGEISGNSRVGGIMGKITVGKKATISDMRNEGMITATEKYAGGIFGYAEGASGQFGTMNGCVNTADITGADCVAGCFGFVDSFIHVTVDSRVDEALNCRNTGDVTATEGTDTGDIYFMN